MISLDSSIWKELDSAAEGVWPLKPDTEAFREFQEGLRGLRRETEKLVTNPNIAAVLGNNSTQREHFALSALAILGNRMHAYGMWLVLDNDWEDCIGVCLCGWEAEVISFRTDKDEADIYCLTISLAAKPDCITLAGSIV